MHMVVHDHMGRNYITLVFEMFDGGHYQGSLLGAETGLLLGKAPSDEIYSPRLSPVWKPSPVDRKVGGLHVRRHDLQNGWTGKMPALLILASYHSSKRSHQQML